MQIAAAQRACEVLGDLVAACAVLPRDGSFYLMQSLRHVFTVELPAHLPASPLSPDSPCTPAPSNTTITCEATVKGFCLMVLRVLSPLLANVAAFSPHISLKLLLAGELTPPLPLCVFVRQVRLTLTACSCEHCRSRVSVSRRQRARSCACRRASSHCSCARLSKFMELQLCSNCMAAPHRCELFRCYIIHPS
jgi:hypothetical protein